MARMSIGEFAAEAGLTPKALRLYDEMGLVRPATVEETNGYRWYEPTQVEGARLVAQLRLVGMPLARIQQVLRLPPESRAAELLSWWRQVESDHAVRRARLAFLAESTGKEQMMQFDQNGQTTVASRSGRGRRDLELDAVFRGVRLFAVADGFGDDSGLPDAVVIALGEVGEPEGALDPLTFLDTTVARVAEAVARRPESIAHRPEAGTTLTVLLLGEGRAAIAHLGDTRVHLVRDGRLERLTRDHSFVQALVDEGRLTPEEARLEEDRALISRALTARAPAEADLSIVATRPGDRFVLTTDGVHAVLPGRLLADLLTSTDSAEEVARSVETAVLGEGAPDNYAVLVVDLTSASG